MGRLCGCDVPRSVVASFGLPLSAGFASEGNCPRSFMKPKAKRTPPTAATNIAAAGLPPSKLSKRNCKPIIGNTNEPKPIKIRVTPHSFIENPFTYYFSATLVPDRFKSSSHEPKNQSLG